MLINKIFFQLNNFYRIISHIFRNLLIWMLSLFIYILSYIILSSISCSPSRSGYTTRVGKLQRSLPRFFDSVSLFGRSLLSPRRVDLMSHLSRVQCDKWTEFAKPGDPWASGRLSTEFLVVPVRGSSIGVRTNTIQGVKQKEVGDPLTALRRYSRKIPVEDPKEFITGTWMDGCFSFWDRVLLLKRFNRNINRRFCNIFKSRDWDPCYVLNNFVKWNKIKYIE